MISVTPCNKYGMQNMNVSFPLPIQCMYIYVVEMSRIYIYPSTCFASPILILLVSIFSSAICSFGGGGGGDDNDHDDDRKMTPTKPTTTENITKKRVCDFGLPAIREAGSIAGSANTISSAAWTAPEVLDDEECSFLSDIYSFGIVIHEMMTQRVPFAGRSVAKVCFLPCNHFTPRTYTNICKWF